MKLKSYSLPYGHATQNVEIDESRVLQVLDMPAIEPMDDIKQGILDAIRNPIGCDSLEKRIKPGDTVTFICNDGTRVAGTERFMPILVDELNRLGVPDANMEIVFALGSHRLMPYEEMAEIVSPNVAARLKMYNNDCNKNEDFDYFGTTSYGTPVWVNKHLSNRDHVILTGTVVFHYLAGFGGGRKSVVPGCARMDTIRESHKWMLDPGSGLGKTSTNPAFNNFLECVNLWSKGKSTFMFNPILDPEHRFLKIFAGDYVKAHEEACKYVAKIYGVPIQQKADIVIASCGGYPKDINVYQMQKTMDTARLALREGGVAIIVAECEEGIGSPALMETVQRCKTISGIEEDLRQHFAIGAHKAYVITRNMHTAKYIMVTALKRQTVKELLFEDATPNLQDALTMAEKLTSPHATVTIMPFGSLTVPIFTE
ncbi:MAG: nickel-dependent lactate racemase [Acidaminococcaceae bacterium]|jgi:nickel-dependent lactate racemase|nr:nickel-dependent lactate racemase [Acidaminococcaceae bacterium]